MERAWVSILPSATLQDELHINGGARSKSGPQSSVKARELSSVRHLVAEVSRGGGAGALDRVGAGVFVDVGGGEPATKITHERLHWLDVLNRVFDIEKKLLVAQSDAYHTDRTLKSATSWH